MGVIKIFKDSWHMYTSKERRNIAFYILGIMLYKFGLEAFNGSIVTLATDRFKAMDTFTKLGALTGLNQAMQCVGAILIVPSLVLTLLTAGPLDQRYRTKTVLVAAICSFALMTVILLIVDAATGGRIKLPSDKTPVYGTYHPNAIFPIYMFSGMPIFPRLAHARDFIRYGRAHPSRHSTRHCWRTCPEAEENGCNGMHHSCVTNRRSMSATKSLARLEHSAQRP